MKQWKFFILFAATILSFPLAAENVMGAHLQTTILAQAINDPTGNPAKIKPGSQVQISAAVKNVGDQPNAPGKIFIRFLFPKPLQNEPRSLIYETETVDLPSIEPGDTYTITFKKPHKWPSIFDFIRNDWAMREYEAIIEIEGHREVTGTRAISFSAFYYEGPSREKPVRFPTPGTVSLEQGGSSLSPRLLPPPKRGV